MRNTTTFVGLVAALAVIVALAVPGSDLAEAHRPKALTERQEKAIADEIRAFRDTLAKAIEKKDVAAIRALYADRFVHTHGSGKVDGKEARVTSILAGHPVIETAPVTDLVIRAPAGWTAVATGVSPIKAADGKTYSFRWTAVYVRGPEGWQLAASQATRMGEVE
jgi:ketosteroid isomerase-like protein